MEPMADQNTSAPPRQIGARRAGQNAINPRPQIRRRKGRRGTATAQSIAAFPEARTGRQKRSCSASLGYTIHEGPEAARKGPDSHCQLAVSARCNDQIVLKARNSLDGSLSRPGSVVSLPFLREAPSYVHRGFVSC